jgi:Arc/MetJ-type ribon-helix-helix transcriptional regulator
MSRSTINISVPADARRYVEKRVKAFGYNSVSEYFRELLRADMLQHSYLANLERRAAGLPTVPLEFRPPAPCRRK